jgi:predicted TIM-barrel fold metal-dependent hydrolase
MFASDVPHEHGSDPDALSQRVPTDVRRKVLFGSAADCYGLSAFTP